MVDIEALDREIDHLADIMDVNELASEAMKYCTAMGTWLRHNIEKLDTDEDKALIAMATLESTKKLKTATINIHEANIQITASFMALEAMKDSIKGGKIDA